MPVPKSFTFSQGKLQDYLDCQRRFELKYLLNRPWPAIVANPVKEYELMTKMGQAFHQMIRQYFLGISINRISPMIHDEKLRNWWNSFLELRTHSEQMDYIWQKQTQNYPEVSITANIANYQIIAKYDLISIIPGEKIIILDWKTSNKIPSPNWLKDRMQTKIYPHLLVDAGAFLNQGRSIDPDSVEMRYWFANNPDQMQIFEYNQDQYLSNKNYLLKLIDEINQKQPNEFNPTTEIWRCRFCTYRSLCGRGYFAGDLSENNGFSENISEFFEPELKIEDISEIEY
jgi:CRISPR/Cas system-associated exonuclease Cas4 (RecB family)